MDKILLSNLSFFGYHGVLAEESVLGQKFFVDIEMFMDLKLAGETDNLDYTVNYAKVYDIAKEYCEGRPFQLIEALAHNIAMKILKNFPVEEVMVRIRKPEAPIRGIFDYAGVEVRRKRND